LVTTSALFVATTSVSIAFLATALAAVFVVTALSTNTAATTTVVHAC